MKKNSGEESKKEEVPISVLKRDMLLAMEERNINRFKKVLDSGLGVNVSFQVTRGRKRVSLVEKTVRQQFSQGLEALLTRKIPCSVKVDSVKEAFAYASKYELYQCVTAILEVAASGSLNMFSQRDLFRHSMEYHRYDLASKCVNTPDFDPNALIPLIGQNWERPLHTAIGHNQDEIARRLLEMGAEVDAVKCSGATPLMIACGNVNARCVLLLLKYGADPNFEVDNRNVWWPLFRHNIGHRTHRKTPHVPEYPTFMVVKAPSHNKMPQADQILEHMLRAGLKIHKNGWIQRTAVLMYFSAFMGQTLASTPYKLPTLQQLALNSAKKQLRIGTGGVHFRTAIDSLPIPELFKEIMKMDDKENEDESTGGIPQPSV